MQLQKHDMDDLFRKAAARYPLQRGNSDWESVAQKLKNAGKPAIRSGSLPGRRYLAWMLLVPVAFVLHNSIEHTGGAVSIAENSYASKKQVAQPAVTTRRNTVIPGAPVMTEETKNFRSAPAAGVKTNSPLSTPVTGHKTNSLLSAQVLRVTGAPVTNGQTNNLLSVPVTKTQSSDPLSAVTKAQPNSLPDAAGTMAEDKILPSAPMDIVETKTPAPSLPHAIAYETLPRAIFSDRASGITDQKNTSNETTRRSPAANGFYLGAGAGLDYGRVKGQSFTDAGYNIGLLLGYRFNRHLSMESGLSYIQKKYFTHGDYFSMTKLQSSMPGMEMVTVKGQLSMFEIPYKIKYDFLQRQRSSLFLSAGGSWNIYVKEDNEYIVRQNGATSLHKASYNDIHCSPLCLVHVSGGYEYSFNNSSRLRLEPYVKFPLRKVGMGSVPVLSVGLNVSVSGLLRRQ